jgi:hypothetical protein
VNNAQNLLLLLLLQKTLDVFKGSVNRGIQTKPQASYYYYKSIAVNIYCIHCSIEVVNNTSGPEFRALQYGVQLVLNETKQTKLYFE